MVLDANGHTHRAASDSDTVCGPGGSPILAFVGMGTAVLVAGVVTIPLPAITANTIVFPTANGGLLNIGTLYVASRVVGTSVTVRSTNILDIRTINWLAIEPTVTAP